MKDQAEEFFKWSECHNPLYGEVVSRYPLISPYKMKRVGEKEVSMSHLDAKDRVTIQETANEDYEGME